MRSWFKGSGGGASSSAKSLSLSSSRNTSTTSQLAAIDPRDIEISDMQHAMEAASRILNDDIEGAESQLRARKDSSTFHSLGMGMTIFMRSILGFEKEIMAEAASRLVECENKALSDMKKAQKQAEGGGGGGWFRGGGGSDGNVAPRGCEMYPPGTEFQLLNAEAQLMGAMISVMHESLTEGIKGFYKLRKAFIVLDGIMEVENRVLARHRTNGAVKEPAASTKEVKDETAVEGADEEDSDLEFVDAEEGADQPQTPMTYEGHLEKTNSRSGPGSVLEKPMGDLALETNDSASVSATRPDTPSSRKGSSPPRAAARQTLLESSGPDTSLFTNPVDAFVHSGANMCFGILLLVISMVPPAFSKLLYIIGFKGDRDRGVQMLWQSTKFPNINGGVAGLMLLGYYNGILAFADILPSEIDVAELADEDEIVGYPKDECIALLARMREQYPDSRMWKNEEARVLANARRLGEAVEMLKANSDSKMRQVTALTNFELSVNALFLMDWPTMRDGFLRCVELNDWSHSLYYFFVGCASLELYRDARQARAAATDAKERSTLDTEAKKHKKAAEEYFRKSPAFAGRKKFLARQMPFEVFALRKVAKWEERAKAWGVDLADAVGASPGQEMTYLWSGSKRMPMDVLERALACLSWDRCTAPADKVDKMRETPDESAIKSVAEGAILCNMGKYNEARKKVVPLTEMDKNLCKGDNKDDWTLPCAHYEMAVLAWREACDKACWPEDAGEIEVYRQNRVTEAENYLDHVKTWESFVLDARIGMRVQTGMDTIAWLKKKKRWA